MSAWTTKTAYGYRSSKASSFRQLGYLAEARIAVFNGTAQDLYAIQAFPKAQISRFNSPADFVLALKTGKVDVAISGLLSIQEIVRENAELAIMAGNFHNNANGVAFRKGDQALRERFDRFLETARADGTLEGMRRRWLVENPEAVVIPAITIPETGETLRVGTSLLIGLPFVSQADGQFIGHDIELVQTFASREGFRLELVPLEFDALIASLATGKIDMIVSQLSITPERQAKVAFSAPYSYENSAALVQKKPGHSPHLGHGKSTDPGGIC
ncbi:MAG: transporter substrate-binding domain-containing protein [Chromatiaceae bacterium]